MDKEIADPAERARREEATKSQRLDAEDNEFLNLLKQSRGKGPSQARPTNDRDFGVRISKPETLGGLKIIDMRGEDSNVLSDFKNL